MTRLVGRARAHGFRRPSGGGRGGSPRPGEERLVQGRPDPRQRHESSRNPDQIGSVDLGWSLTDTLLVRFGAERVAIFREESPLNRAVRRAQREVAGEAREVIIVLGPDGAVVYRGEGDANEVLVPRSALPGNIAIHNHPGGDSFSRQDVRLLLEQKMLQMRVVTSDWEYVLDSPADTRWQDVEETVRAVMDQVQKDHVRRILEGTLTFEESERTRWHDIWQGVSEIRGWRYRRQPLANS